MALARIQTAILQNLLKMGRLTEVQFNNIAETDEEMSGEAIADASLMKPLSPN